MPSLPHRAVVLAACALLVWPGHGLGQDSPTPRPPACAPEEFRSFDFWIGSWIVTTEAGDTLGWNDVSPVSNGCALLESWRSNGGPAGRSLNYYEPRERAWRQVWVGGDGLTLRMTGGPLEDGSMQLIGEERPGRTGPIRDRVTWSRLGEDRVVQHWQITRDGGHTWETAFRGFYRPEPVP